MSFDKRRSFNPRKRETRTPGHGRRPSASNAVVTTILQTAAIFGQPCYRMQSRAFDVPGEEGKTRPFFVGAWTDRFGQTWFGGMPDCLCTPTIELSIPGDDGKTRIKIIVQVALWVECKSGRGALTEKQVRFRENVFATGGEWIECRDNADALLTWFKNHKLVRP